MAQPEQKKQTPAPDVSGANKKSKEKKPEMSEEDREKKEEIELLVERVHDENQVIAKNAINALREEVRSASSSISSIPKAIKFLRQSYGVLKQVWETLPQENQTLLADTLSVLAMTSADLESRESLKFRLLGSKGDLELWGHEYIRNLSQEIITEFEQRQNEEKPIEDLLELVSQIVPFNISHNAEPAACDLLMEVKRLPQIIQFVDESNFGRIGLYLSGCVKYAPDPDDSEILKVILEVHLKMKKLPEALTLAIQLDDHVTIDQIFENCSDRALKKQLAFIAGSQHLFRVNVADDEELAKIIGNGYLSEHYKALGKALEVSEPKTPSDIYKTHLIDNRQAQNIRSLESAKQNLASTFVNAFVNCGFGTDKLLSDEKLGWVGKNKEHGQISAVASHGLLYLWDPDTALNPLDEYLSEKNQNEHRIAGALLGVGLATTRLQLEHDPALVLLQEHIHSSNEGVQINAILGLGFAYAGSAREELAELLVPLLEAPETSIEVLSITSYALGLIFVGTANGSVSLAMIDALVFRGKDFNLGLVSLLRFFALGLGLLFLGRSSHVDIVLQSIALDTAFGKYAYYTVKGCAYAGTGNVIEIQKMLHACTEQSDIKGDYNAVCVLGLASIAISEEIGEEMAIRMTGHLLQYGEQTIKKTAPLALGLLSISNPRLTVMDTLSKLSHDSDNEISQNAILALGLIGAGTNNARIAQLLRLLSGYYSKEASHLFVVRIAQGLLHLGKGLVTLNPYHLHGSVLSKVGVAGLLGLLHSCIDLPNLIHGKYHYLLFNVTLAIRPRMFMTFDEDLNPLEVSVRVGQAVDTVGQAGKPKTITGFQTHATPVLLSVGDRAELANEDYQSLSPFLEFGVILKKKSD